MLYCYAAWMAIMNVAAFFAMRSDKKRAVRHRRRISERTLFTLAALGGAAGGWLGMYAFRHKTRHPAFVVGMPLLTVGHVLLAVFLLR